MSVGIFPWESEVFSRQYFVTYTKLCICMHMIQSLNEIVQGVSSYAVVDIHSILSQNILVKNFPLNLKTHLKVLHEPL